MRFLRRHGWKKEILFAIAMVLLCVCLGYKYYVYKSRLKHVYFPILPISQRRLRQGGVWANKTVMDADVAGLQNNVYFPDELIEAMSVQEIESSFFLYIEHKYVLCSDNHRLGNQHDGGWNVCLSPPFTIRKPCLVYSFGIGSDWRFEDDMYDLYKCQVMAYDPSIGEKEHNRTTGIWFKPIGLGTTQRQTARMRRWKLKTFQQILTDEGHLETTIDYLKFDIENMEWEAIKELVDGDKPLQNVKQLAFEIHLLNPSKNHTAYNSIKREDFVEKYKILRLVESAGFRRFDYRLNPFCMYKSKLSAEPRSGCYELFYLNMKYVEDKHLRDKPYESTLT